MTARSIAFEAAPFSLQGIQNGSFDQTASNAARPRAAPAGPGTVFAGGAAAKLGRLRGELEPLAGRYDVVVANPPYMGSSSLGPWLSPWVKKAYPDEKSDLCTCFIERGFSLAREDGASAMVTMQSWMFLGSFEKMRAKLLAEHGILSMAHLGTRAFSAIAGEVVSTTATVFSAARSEAPGAYLRLVDMGSEDEKRAGALEALADPGCGWLYRRGAEAFEAIPGSPIAYWASNRLLHAFSNQLITAYGQAYEGIKTGDNERFLRYWQEVSAACTNITNGNDRAKWQRTAKASEFRRWIGSHYIVTNFNNDGEEMITAGHASIVSSEPLRSRAITWTRTGSGLDSFRLLPGGFLSNVGGLCFYAHDQNDLYWILAFVNSSVAEYELGVINPTVSLPPGTFNSIACQKPQQPLVEHITDLAKSNISMALQNWNTLEVSWDFKRHPIA